MDKPPDIEADVRFFTTAEGGRLTRVKSVYRPDHAMGKTDILNGARHLFPDCDCVELGETVRSFMTFTWPEYQTEKLWVGLEFRIQEGSKIVGRGRVTKIFTEAMKVVAP